MERQRIEKYKNYPEGSPQKAVYDFYYLEFQDYLGKYYKCPDFTRWELVNSKFVTPLFDGTSWVDYWNFLNQAKPQFAPDRVKLNDCWERIKNINKFSLELKHFFVFLYSIDFFRNLSFDEWLNAKNWMHPWYEDDSEQNRSINEIVNYEYGENFLKIQFAELSIFKQG